MDRPNFLSLYDLGAMFIDTGRKSPTRQTLIRRGEAFAALHGLHVHTLPWGRFVSAREVDRIMETAA